MPLQQIQDRILTLFIIFFQLVGPGLFDLIFYKKGSLLGENNLFPQCIISFLVVVGYVKSLLLMNDNIIGPANTIFSCNL